MTRTFDAVIIGGGIMGCCVAFELTRRRWRVVVLEKNAIGSGSTGRSSAILRQHYSNELTARMAKYGVATFRYFDDIVGGDVGFHQTGFLILGGPGDAAQIASNVALQRRVGIRTELLSVPEVRELRPDFEFRDLAAAAYEPESGFADPHLAVQGYARSARQHGATLLPDTEVLAIRFAGPHVTGVDVRNGSFDAPVIINCAGPWSARVAHTAGVALPVNACRAQVAVFQRPVDDRSLHPVVIDLVNTTYFRSDLGGVSLVGVVDPAEGAAVVDPDDYPEYLDTDFVAQVGERWLRRCPSMEHSLSLGGYAGLYAVTPDWHPIIDEVPPDSGHFVCTGFSGHGFKLAPAVGRMMADLVTHCSTPEFPTEAFRLDRYGENRAIHGSYACAITG